MAGIINNLLSIASRLGGTVAEGASRALASFAERYDRHASLLYEQRAHLPRGGLPVRRHDALPGERMMSSMMRGAGGIGWPASWTQDRTRQIAAFHRWVYIAVDCICSRIAAMPPRVAVVRHAAEQKDGRVQKALQVRYRKSLHAIKPHEEVIDVPPDHPLCKLLARPNAWVKSPGRLWYQLGMFLCLTGNSYQWIVPDGAFGKPLEIWTIPSHWVFGPKLGAGGMQYYQIQPFVGGVGGFTIPAEEIVHYAFDNPLNPIDGWSPAQAASEWIDVAQGVDQSRYFSMVNGSQANGALELGPKYDPSDTDIEAIGAKFLARYQGVRNAGVPVILPPDVKFTPLTIAPTEMAYTETFDQLRDAILAAFRVPKEIAGIQDAGSEIAMYGPMKQFNEGAIFPKLRMIGDTFTASVCHKWSDELRLFWEDHTLPDPETVNADLNTNFTNGLMTINEGRAERGLQPLDDPMADEVLVDPNKIPLSMLAKKAEMSMQPPAPLGGEGGPPGAEGFGDVEGNDDFGDVEFEDDDDEELTDLEWKDDPEDMEDVAKGWGGRLNGVLKSWEESKHPRDHGKFSSSPGSGGGDIEGAKQKWREAVESHQAARQHIMQHLEEGAEKAQAAYDKHAATIKHLNESLDFGEEGSEHEKYYLALDETVVKQLRPAETPGERFEALGDVIWRAKEFHEVAEDDESKSHAKQIIAAAKAGRQALRDYADHKKKLRAVKRGEVVKRHLVGASANGNGVHKSDQPRVPSGHREGGQFAKKDEGGSFSFGGKMPHPDTPATAHRGDARAAHKAKVKEGRKLARKVEHLWFDLPMSVLEGSEFDRLKDLTDWADSAETLENIRHEAARLSSALSTREPHADEETEDDRKEAIGVLREMGTTAGRAARVMREAEDMKPASKKKSHEPKPEEPEEDDHGGVIPEAKDRAKAVDLITLPDDVKGTNCGLCVWIDEDGDYCTNPKVDMPVNERMCCNLWQRHGTLREYEKKAAEPKVKSWEESKQP